MFEVVILQQTLASLVADWAVDWMIDQKILFDHRAVLFDLVAIQ